MDVKKLLKLKEKKLARMGPHYIVIIPRNYIKNGLIDPHKLYNVYFEETEKVT